MCWLLIFHLLPLLRIYCFHPSVLMSLGSLAQYEICPAFTCDVGKQYSICSQYISNLNPNDPMKTLRLNYCHKQRLNYCHRLHDRAFCKYCMYVRFGFLWHLKIKWTHVLLPKWVGNAIFWYCHSSWTDIF